MVENFSSSYYFTELLITPHGGDRAIIQTDSFELYQKEYSNTRPLVVKVDGWHIPVYEEYSVPCDVLAVPESTYSRLDVSGDEATTVFLAKEKTVDRLIQMNLVETNERQAG